MARFGVKEVADVIFYDLANNGKPSLFLDSLKLSNLENDAETSYVQGGRGNARIMSFDFNRTASFAVQDALMNPKAIAMQAGAEVVKGAVNAHKREVLTVTDSGTVATVATAKTPISVATTTVYKTDASGYEHLTEVTVSAVGSNSITLDTAQVVQGDKVVVYYQYQTTADAEQVIISSDKYSGFYKVVGLTVIRNASTNKDEAFEIEIPKAKIMSAFSINLTPDGEPAVFDMNLDVFKDTASTQMVKLTRIG